VGNAPDPILVGWHETVNRVRDELTQLSYDRELFRRVDKLIQAEPRLATSGHPFLYRMRAWYTYSAIMTIRRQADRRTDVRSLRAMLAEMITHSALLTRHQIEALYRSDPTAAGHLSRYPEMLDMFSAWTFVATAAKADDYIDEQIFKGDLDQLDSVATKVKRFANKMIAHTAKSGAEAVINLTFREIDAAIDVYHDIAIKYIGLLTGASYFDLTPTDQFDSLSIFRFAWAPERRTVSGV